MSEESILGHPEWPGWFDGKRINEPAFCDAYLAEHRLAFTANAFFTPEGRVDDLNTIREEIYRMIKPYAHSSVTKKVTSIMDLLQMTACKGDLPPQPDRIHLNNGTLFLDGSFVSGKNEIVRSRLPIAYTPDAPEPERWLSFLNELLWPEDIPTLQEYIGYCLIPSNAGQKMMVIKGNGGEGKSLIGGVLFKLFGVNAKDGSIGKVSENAFARADIEHVLLMIDDDMRLEALKQTNYVKSIVTSQGKMDLERKGKQSYQGWMFARLLAFSNGDLESLYDRSDGFYRRQLILTARGKRPDRVDDPFLSAKLAKELPGIFNWAFEGLQRLVANGFRFTESERSRMSRENARRSSNNILLFLDAKGYIRRDPNARIWSKDLGRLYQYWCYQNAYPPVKNKTLIEYFIAHQEELGITYTNRMLTRDMREVRGFTGIGPALPLSTLNSSSAWGQTGTGEEQE